MGTDLLDIAKGDVANETPLDKFGFRAAVGTEKVDVWEYEDALPFYPWLDRATRLYVSSSSPNDRADGSGARTVNLMGLGPDWREADEKYIPLDGQNRVRTNGSFVRNNRAMVETAGGSGWGEGIIFFHDSPVTEGIPDDPEKVYVVICPGRNQTLMALWTVPVDKRFFLAKWWATTASERAMEADLFIRERADADGVFQLKGSRHVRIDAPLDHDYPLPPEYPGKSDIVIRANRLGVAAYPGEPVKAGFAGWYERDWPPRSKEG